MGFREDQLFVFNYALQKGQRIEYISYNSEVLDRFSWLIDEAGIFSAMRGSPNLYLKQKGLEKLVRVFRRARGVAQKRISRTLTDFEKSLTRRIDRIYSLVRSAIP